MNGIDLKQHFPVSSIAIVLRTSVSVLTILGITPMGNAFRNKQRTGLMAAVSVMLLALAGCSSLPEVKPPNPMQSDVEGQIRQFKGFTPQQVLAAAEDVLRRHLPEAKFARSADTLEMEWHHEGFIVIVGWQLEERWVVHAREEDHVTVASVAMNKKEAEWGFPYGVNMQKFPSGWIRIDYGMFWHRVQSILTGAPWPECSRAFKIVIFPSYFEPLCIDRTTNQYQAK